jgi:hypothetical protein
MNSITVLSPTQLRQAADIQEQILALQQQLGELLGSAPQTEATAEKQPKRKISAAGIARIRAAQKARWAKAKGTLAPEKPTNKPKRKMSPAVRARLAALAKARWRKAKAAGKSRL